MDIGKWKKEWGVMELVLLAVLFLSLILFVLNFLPPQTEAQSVLFVVEEEESVDVVAQNLEGKGLVRSDNALKVFLFLYGNEVSPGGYRLSADMSVWSVAKALSEAPVTQWVEFEEGMRKEEMAPILAENLNLDKAEIQRFLKAPEEIEDMLAEGMFFPDRYLFPVDEGGKEIARRMFNRFNEEMKQLFERSIEENVRWDTAITLASIVQREATEDDMPLVAGILWNRLFEDMRLEVDATIQYVRGKEGGGWWAPIDPKHREIDSPYNTYMYEGLPPTPISNPGTGAVKAVLNPEDTECLYYIHSQRQIYCSRTYEGHLENINTHLKN